MSESQSQRRQRLQSVGTTGGFLLLDSAVACLAFLLIIESNTLCRGSVHQQVESREKFERFHWVFDAVVKVKINTQTVQITTRKSPLSVFQLYATLDTFLLLRTDSSCATPTLCLLSLVGHDSVCKVQQRNTQTPERICQ
jgi:hypothetical protein